jgi:hypothetical protein
VRTSSRHLHDLPPWKCLDVIAGGRCSPRPTQAMPDVGRHPDSASRGASPVSPSAEGEPLIKGHSGSEAHASTDPVVNEGRIFVEYVDVDAAGEHHVGHDHAQTA